MRLLTQADVDLLAPEWPGVAAGDRGKALRAVNAWLQPRVRRDVPTPLPAVFGDVLQLLLPLAAAGTLLRATEREVLSQTVSATSGTSVSQTFTAGDVDRSAEENTALALLAAYTSQYGCRTVMRG